MKNADLIIALNAKEITQHIQKYNLECKRSQRKNSDEGQ